MSCVITGVGGVLNSIFGMSEGVEVHHDANPLSKTPDKIALQAELKDLKLGGLRKRAAESGASGSDINKLFVNKELNESELRQALIALILQRVAGLPDSSSSFTSPTPAQSSLTNIPQGGDKVKKPVERRSRFVRDVLPRPTEGEGLLCLSYNILVPNAEASKGSTIEGAWWVYKMYREPTHSEWLARKELLKQQLVHAELSSRFDVICLQEVAPVSFETDFDFLVEAGYSTLLHQSENHWMRPATFWLNDAWERIWDMHLPRTLVTVLRARRSGKVVFIVNVHLVAGVEAIHVRFRHTSTALDAVFAKIQELGLEASTTPVVFCGDFNAEGLTAVRELFVTGRVLPDFREPLDPSTQITKNGRFNPLGVFSDAADIAFDGHVPATMLASNGYAKMLRDAKGTKGPPTEKFLEAIEEVFKLCCSEQRSFMVQDDIDRWLMKANGALGRGQSYTFLLEKIRGRQEPVLQKDDFIDIYVQLLRKGLLHEVQHDLVALGGRSLEIPSEGPNELRFDYMYFTSSSLRLVGIQKALTDDQCRRIWSEPWEIIPNAWHPSDHLPVAASFEFV